MNRSLVGVFVLLAACAHGPLMADSSGQSANSSGQSGNSSAQTGNSSGQSANSSANSGTSGNSAQSSGGSAASSAGSAQSSNASAGSSQGSQQSSDTSNQSSGSTAASNASSRSSNVSGSSANSSSQVAVGSALLSAVVGGIITTVYSVKWRREAKLAQDQLRQLQQAPVPQPMPYPVQPLPPAPVAPPPPDPGFNPAPYVPPAPKKTSLDEPPRFDAMVQARSWLMANELQLQQDLALGAGPTLEDLAGLAGILPAHQAHFGRVLQRHRASLLVSRQVTPEEAAAVLARVGDLVMTDPVLRPDGLAVLAAW